MAIILKTKRLILRHQIMDDLDDLWALYCDPEITKHIPDAPRSREEADYIQHINETCYRLVRGDTLMRKVLSDSALGITILRSLPEVDRERIGYAGSFLRRKYCLIPCRTG
ncbi:MAG TPA: GNAT family N-acetyltransferase [Anaerolineales bacterium]|nr:GNAT family N-acetyltransferase [Anaerolineales bacterium]